MKPLSLAAAVVCLAAFPALFTVADDEPVRTIPELTLEERIVDLLETIEDESPEIYRRINELPREEALARIMRALDSGVVPASSGTERPPLVRAGDRNYPVFGITDRAFPYIRIDALTPDAVAQSVQDLETMKRVSAPTGAIVDLRETTAGDDDSVKALAEALRKLECPIMALVSAKTSGKGELMAAVLRRDGGALLLGTETAGCVFPLKRISVNDVRWFVPDPPTEYYDISPYALKPDLEKSSQIRMSFDELKEKPNSLDGDPVLRLAADLLTMKAAVKPAEPDPAL